MNLLKQILVRIDSNNLWEDKKILKRYDFLKHKGTKDTRLYFVVDGCFRIYIEDAKEEHTIRFGYKNNLITALDSFISDAPSQLIIQTLRRSKVKVLSKSKFEAFIQSDIENLKLWQKCLETLIFQQMERELDILAYSPKERYLRLKTRSPQVFQEVPAKYIASYLRMTPETLSRLNKS